MSQVIIRQAEFADIDQIVELDSKMYEGITPAQTDDPRGMFEKRIANSHGWFWVAEVGGRIEGILSCQPTKLAPDDFVSWEHTTNNGTFNGTYDETSPFIYVAALTVSPKGSRLDATDMLMAAGVKQAIARGKKLAFFSARMPGYHLMTEQMSAEEYYNATTTRNGKEVAFDRQIRYYEQLGAKRVRLVENGFEADWKSCGYAVLFIISIPFYGWRGKRMWAWLFGKIAERPRLFAFCAKHL